MMYWRDVNGGSNACCVHSALIQTKFQIPTIPSPPTPIPACVCVCVCTQSFHVRLVSFQHFEHFAVDTESPFGIEMDCGYVRSVRSFLWCPTLCPNQANGSPLWHCQHCQQCICVKIVWWKFNGNTIGYSKIASPFVRFEGRRERRDGFLFHFWSISLLFQSYSIEDTTYYNTEWVLCIGNGNKELSGQQTQ